MPNEPENLCELLPPKLGRVPILTSHQNLPHLRALRTSTYGCHTLRNHSCLCWACSSVSLLVHRVLGPDTPTLTDLFSCSPSLGRFGEEAGLDLEPWVPSTRPVASGGAFRQVKVSSQGAPPGVLRGMPPMLGACSPLKPVPIPIPSKPGSH